MNGIEGESRNKPLQLGAEKPIKFTRIFFNKWYQNNYLHVNNEFGPLRLQKLAQSGFTDLNLRAKTLRRKQRNNIHDHGLGNGFLDTTAKAQAKIRSVSSTSVKIKSFCASMDTIKKVSVRSYI